MSEEFDIQGSLKELVEITKELKLTSDKAKELRVQKKELEQQINEYLKFRDQPGIKYGSLIIFAEEKQKRVTKKKKVKEADTVKLLESAGVKNPKEFYQTMIESFKGEKTTVDSIKMKSISSKS